MSPRMACSLTTDAVRARIKTVTRRKADSWLRLRPGDHITLVEKAMGLPKGSHQVVLADVEVLDVRVEPIVHVSRPGELEAEGFADWTPEDFVRFWLDSHGYRRLHGPDAAATPCRRIQWRYLDDLYLVDDRGQLRRITTIDTELV